MMERRNALNGRIVVHEIDSQLMVTSFKITFETVACIQSHHCTDCYVSVKSHKSTTVVVAAIHHFGKTIPVVTTAYYIRVILLTTTRKLCQHLYLLSQRAAITVCSLARNGHSVVAESQDGAWRESDFVIFRVNGITIQVFYDWNNTDFRACPLVR